jgi:hypothetical protein
LIPNHNPDGEKPGHVESPLGVVDLTLARIPHPSKAVLITGVRPTDRYVEDCWLPVVGPTTFALLRRLDQLTGPVGAEPARIPCEELSQMLGLSAREQPTRSNPIGKTLGRAHQFGVARCDLSTGLVELPEPLPLLSARKAARLPLSSLRAHVAHLEQLSARLAGEGIKAPEAVIAAAANALPLLRGRQHIERLDAVAQAEHCEPPAASL